MNTRVVISFDFFFLIKRQYFKRLFTLRQLFLMMMNNHDDLEKNICYCNISFGSRIRINFFEFQYSANKEKRVLKILIFVVIEN